MNLGISDTFIVDKSTKSIAIPRRSRQHRSEIRKSIIFRRLLYHRSLHDTVFRRISAVHRNPVSLRRRRYSLAFHSSLSTHSAELVEKLLACESERSARVCEWLARGEDKRGKKKREKGWESARVCGAVLS